MVILTRKYRSTVDLITAGLTANSLTIRSKNSIFYIQAV